MKLIYIIIFSWMIGLIENIQTSYRFVHDFAKLEFVDRKYVPMSYCKFSKVNRTYAAFGCNLTTSVDVVAEYEPSIQVKTFQFYSNEYRPSIIEFTLNFCNFLKKATNDFDVKSILKNSNVPRQCPIKKGFYYVYDVMPDAKQFPPHIPPGKWRVDLHFWYKKMELAVLQWMLTVVKNN